jgi:hypothetical protein
VNSSSVAIEAAICCCSRCSRDDEAASFAVAEDDLNFRCGVSAAEDGEGEDEKSEVEVAFSDDAAEEDENDGDDEDGATAAADKLFTRENGIGGDLISISATACS